MKYLIEKIVINGVTPPGYERIEITGSKYEISDNILRIFDYDDNISLDEEIIGEFKLSNLESGEVIFENK